jgi:hypothetical protein
MGSNNSSNWRSRHLGKTIIPPASQAWLGGTVRKPARLLSGEVWSPGGQAKSELGAAAGCSPYGDGTTVRLDQALHDVEAEAGAAARLAVTPPELPEDAGHGFGRDALALVAHGHDGSLLA